MARFARGVMFAVYTSMLFAAGCAAPGNPAARDAGADVRADVTGDDPAALVALVVTPATAVLACGASTTLTATARYTDGTHTDVTAAARWTSSDASVAVIDARGVVRAVGAGVATIGAEYSGATAGAATLMVTCDAVVAIEVTPETATLRACADARQAFVAAARLADGSRRDVTAFAQWESSAGDVAIVSNEPGARGEARPGIARDGTALITARVGDVTSPGATITVTAVERFESLAVTPARPSLEVGGSVQLVARGVLADGSRVDLAGRSGLDRIWTSSAPAVASVGADGSVTARAEGTTEVTASIATACGARVSGSTTVTVGPATLVAIQVSPLATSIAVGNTQAFTATGIFSDGSSRALRTGVLWSISPSTVATHVRDGVALGRCLGTATMRAQIGTLSGAATLVVTGVVVRSLAVTPPNPVVWCGSSQQLRATATFSDGTTQNVTSSVAWSSAMPSIASVSSTGMLTGIAGGPVVITAQTSLLPPLCDGMDSSTAARVMVRCLDALTLAPDAPGPLAVGTSMAVHAIGVFEDGVPADVTSDPGIAFTTSDPSVATISNDAGSRGLVTAISAGTVTLGAHWSGLGLPRDAAGVVVVVSAPL